MPNNLPLEIVEMFGNTILKIVPVTLGLAVVFSVLSYFWACNPGNPWWRKKELVTDICYWFFVPLITRVVRIGLLVLAASVFFGIKDAESALAISKIADAVIIGSRIVQEIESAGAEQAVARVKALLAPIRKALDA